MTRNNETRLIWWGIICGLTTALVFGVIALSTPDNLEAARGRMTQAGYVLTNPPDPTNFLRANEQGFVAVKTTSKDGGAGINRVPGWKHASTSTIDTALGGMGRTRYTTGENGEGVISIGTSDAGLATVTPLSLHTYAGGTSPTANHKGMIYRITAIANDGTDFAEWELSGAVKNTTGTIAAVGSSNVIGTAIAPTNRSNGAKEWRLKPVSNSGYLDWQIIIAGLDMAGSGSTVKVWVDEVTLP